MDEKKKKILIADDEPDMLNELEAVLSDKFRVYKAKDGKKAVALAQSSKPEIVLMDANMPEMDGMEACRLIKNDSLTARIPVIMLTCRGGILDIENGFKAGADSYIVKPIVPDRLLDKIEVVLAKAAIT